MTDYQNYLKSVLRGESKAYGFTIGFWGSGMVLVMQEAINNFSNVISFGLGAVIGVAILSLIAFNGVLKTTASEKSSFMVLGTIHYLAALVPIIITYLIISLHNSNVGILLAGANVSLTYNVLILVEEKIAEDLSGTR